MSTWFEIIHDKTGEILVEVDSDETCTAYEAFCGSCGSCLILQAEYAGHTVRAMQYGPIDCLDLSTERGHFKFLDRVDFEEAMRFIRLKPEHYARRMGTDRYNLFILEKNT